MTKTRSARETTHTCKAPGCNRQVPKRYLMCREHWYQVPEPIRLEIWAAWAEVQTTGQITIRYAHAVRDAINALKLQDIPRYRIDPL